VGLNVKGGGNSERGLGSVAMGGGGGFEEERGEGSMRHMGGAQILKARVDERWKKNEERKQSCIF